MDPVTQARMIASNTPSGSPMYQLACGLCLIRMIDPNGFSMGIGMSNWQAVIMEVALAGMLEKLLPL